MRPVASSLSASLFTVSQSAPDLSLIFLESLEHFIELYLVNCILELLLSILSKRFRCSNESNHKAIRDRSSRVETLNTCCNLHFYLRAAISDCRSEIKIAVAIVDKDDASCPRGER